MEFDLSNSRLWQILSALSPKEQRAFRKFVESPFFNQRSDLVDLLQILLQSLKTKAPNREALLRQLSPKQALDLPQLRLLMTYLLRLLEQFLTYQQFQSDHHYQQHALAAAYRQRQLAPHFKRILQRAFTQLDHQPARHQRYWEQLAQLRWERYQLESTQEPLKALNLQSVADATDVAYFANKLRLACLALAHQRVYKQASFQTSLLEEILQTIDQESLLEIPVLQIYFYCYQMLQAPDNEGNFLAFKQSLLDFGRQFPSEEIRDLYLLAINFCIRQVNNGNWDQRYFIEVLELYKEGLAAEYLLENGILSRFTYYNVIVAALKVKEFDWEETFIEQYYPYLEKAYQKSVYSFNQARLAYARKRYDDALEWLQDSNYRDTLLNLAARTISIKIYYETAEWDLLSAQLEAMKNYLRRKVNISYHRKLYKSFIRYTQRLTTVNTYDRAALVTLENQVSQEDNLTEKEWLLEQIKELK